MGSNHPNSLKNLEKRKPFVKNDPRLRHDAHKGMKSAKSQYNELLNMTPAQFYKIFGNGTVPPQYRDCTSMRKAIAGVAMGIALGNIKGDKLRAVNSVFDRTDGKPSQHVHVSSDLTEKDFQEMSDEELAKVAEGKE